jgi:hypothetical protein
MVGLTKPYADARSTIICRNRVNVMCLMSRAIMPLLSTVATQADIGANQVGER